MSIQVGDTMPEGRLNIMKADGPGSVSAKELFDGKKVVLFSVPGAFTPTCSRDHLPGFVEKADEIKAKGVDTVACMAVNDAFVMDAWGKQAGADGKVLMLADGNGDYTRALDLVMDGTGFGLGMRGRRFALIVNDGKVEQAFVEEGGQFKVSSADNVLAHL
jgi:peroxiredoxin